MSFLFVDDNAEPGVELFETIAEFWMRQSVDDGIEDGRCLGADDWHFGHECSDITRIVPSAHHSQGSKRRPRDDPHGDIYNSYFSSADLRLDGFLLIVAASQGCDVHFLGLLAQLLFVIKHGFNDEEVATDDGEYGHEVRAEASSQNITFVIHCLRVRVERTPENYEIKNC